MRIKTVLLGVAFGVVAVVLYLDHRATRLTIADLRNQLARIDEKSQDQVATAPRIITVPVRMPLGTGNIAPAAAPAPPPEVAERSAPRTDPGRGRPETMMESFVPIRKSLEALYQSEVPDPSWSERARSLAENALAAHLPDGSRLGAIDCRASVCRIESTHDRQKQADEFIHKALAEPATRPWNGGFAVGPIAEDPATGRVTTLLFLMRESKDLPPVEDPVAQE